MSEYRKGKFKYGFNMNKGDVRNEEAIMQAFIDYTRNHYVAEKIEEAIAGLVCGKKIDYRILSAETKSVVGYAEVKRRNLTHASMVRLGGLFLSKKKYTLLQTKMYEARCIYLVGLNDVIGYHSINDDEIVDEYMGGGGATNRNSPNDIEKMMVFNPDQFKIIGVRP